MHGLRVTGFIFFHAFQHIAEYPGYTGIMLGSPDPGPPGNVIFKFDCDIFHSTILVLHD